MRRERRVEGGDGGSKEDNIYLLKKDCFRTASMCELVYMSCRMHNVDCDDVNS